MLKTLHADGYRLLDDFDADFGQLTVVVGANACGKSTVLDCLGFISQTASGLADAISSRHGMSSILSAGGKRKELEVGLSFDNSGPLIWGWLSAEGKLDYRVRLQQSPGGRPALQSEVLRAVKEPGGQERVYLANSPEGFFVYDEDKKELVPFDQPPERAGAPSRSSASSRGGTPEFPPEPLLRLAQIQYPQKFPAPSSVRDLLRVFRIYSAFDVGSASPVRTQLAAIRPDDTSLWNDAGNLGPVLHEILTKLQSRSVAEEIRAFLGAAYPQVEDITTETAYGAPASALVRIRERGFTRPMDIWDLSDGMLRFLCLATALLGSGPCSLVAIDEPEAGLHPKLLPIVGDMIKTASERTQVLITTHSPDLLSCFALEDIVVMRREESRATWDRPGTNQALKRMLESTLGGTVGDLHRSGELEGIVQ